MIKKYLVIGASGLLLAAGWFVWRHFQHKQDTQVLNTALAPNEEAKVIIDPTRRQMTIVTSGHIKTMTLPDRPSSISLLKGDGIKIVSPQIGTELRPFLMGAYTLDGGKLGGGIDLLYYKRFDLGVGMMLNPSYVQNTTLFLGASVFVYSNTSLMIGLDNKTTPVIGIKVRL